MHFLFDTKHQTMPKIYTRKGDDGTTGLLSGRVSKADPRIEAIGQLDTLNANVGYLLDLLREVLYKTSLGSYEEIKVIIYDPLVIVQNLIFTLGSQLADVEGKCEIVPVDEGDVKFLEEEIDTMTKKLPKLKKFILPRGHPVVSWTHVVRTTCRTAERACVQIKNPPPHLLPYLNRLSDYLFTLARYLSSYLNVEEVIWEAKRREEDDGITEDDLPPEYFKHRYTTA